MSSTYPGIKDTFTNPVGTNTLDSPDHAVMHTNENDAILAIQTTLGTNAGTSVLKNFTAGDLVPKANNQTFGSPLLQSPAIAGGTISSTIQNNGTIVNGVINSGTINTSAFNGGTTGTVVNTGGLSLKDNGALTQTGTADHITLTPGASKFIRRSLYRQDNTGTNSFLSNQVTLAGWGFVKVAAGAQVGTKAIVFGSIFANAPIVITSMIGITLGTAAAIGDFTTTLSSNGQNMAFGANSITGTGFTASIFVSSVVGADTEFGFGWMAIGSIA